MASKGEKRAQILERKIKEKEYVSISFFAEKKFSYVLKISRVNCHLIEELSITLIMCLKLSFLTDLPMKVIMWIRHGISKSR